MGDISNLQSRRRVLDLTRNSADNYLAMILCFDLFGFEKRVSYSVRNITSGVTWSDRSKNYCSGSYITIIPRSILWDQNSDCRFEFRADRDFIEIYITFER